VAWREGTSPNTLSCPPLHATTAYEHSCFGPINSAGRNTWGSVCWNLSYIEFTLGSPPNFHLHIPYSTNKCTVLLLCIWLLIIWYSLQLINRMEQYISNKHIFLKYNDMNNEEKKVGCLHDSKHICPKVSNRIQR